MLAEKYPNFIEDWNLDDIFEEDKSMNCSESSTEGLENSSIRVVLVNGDERNKSFSVIPFIESIDDNIELENVDKTRIYTPTEWQLLQTLMKTL